MKPDRQVQTEIYGDYAGLLGDDPAWRIGTFPLADGGVWEMREPDAMAIVRNGNLQISVAPLTSYHDKNQILDNAKHILFSTRTFSVPPDAGLSFEVSMKVRRGGAVADDLYDAYGSLLILDFSTGTAIDWFVAEDLCAPAFARLPFPGLDLPAAEPYNYWAIFTERKLEPTPDGFHRFRIEIEPQQGITWLADGQQVSHQGPPTYRFGEMLLGLGIMTEKDIGPHGSTSLHGQGIQVEWSPIEVKTRFSPRPRSPR